MCTVLILRHDVHCIGCIEMVSRMRWRTSVGINSHRRTPSSFVHATATGVNSLQSRRVITSARLYNVIAWRAADIVSRSKLLSAKRANAARAVALLAMKNEVPLARIRGHAKEGELRGKTINIMGDRRRRRRRRAAWSPCNRSWTHDAVPLLPSSRSWGPFFSGEACWLRLLVLPSHHIKRMPGPTNSRAFLDEYDDILELVGTARQLKGVPLGDDVDDVRVELRGVLPTFVRDRVFELVERALPVWMESRGGSEQHTAVAEAGATYAVKDVMVFMLERVTDCATTTWFDVFGNTDHTTDDMRGNTCVFRLFHAILGHMCVNGRFMPEFFRG